MNKVIVERPRMGSRRRSRKKGYRKYIERTRVEDLPRHEPMLGRWKGREKHLNEHLGPMRRFLRSNVGRPWNKVHQELCEHVNFDNAVQAHVLSHIFDYVHKHVEILGEAIVAFRPWGYPRTLRPGEMYVCPRTGLLKAVAPSKRRTPRRRLIHNTHLQYHWRDGAWWELRTRERPDDPEGLWDVWLEREVCDISVIAAEREYASKVFACSKRPLTRDETRLLLRRLRHQRQRR